MGTEIKIGNGQTVTVDTVRDVDLDVEPIYLNGKRLTEADVARMASEIASRNGALGGRPSLARGVSPQVSFRVPQAVKDQLRAVAEHAGRTQSEVAREALERGLALVG